MPANWGRYLGFGACAVWLAFTVAFLGMVTSGGEPGMELQIGPYLKLQDSAAMYFSRGAIALGILTVILFVLRLRAGFALALAWSAWWAILLATALLSVGGLADGTSIGVAVLLLIASGWYAWFRLTMSKGV